MFTRLETWLTGLPREAGYPCVSDAKRFQHDEAAYDAQYGNEPDNLACGHGAVGFAREHGVGMEGPALELGCGTGLMSLGLADSGAFPSVLLTDPSPAFLKITREKLARAGVATGAVRFALLRGEDVQKLPDDMFSVIAMRSALHHVLHADRFIADVAPKLRRGGGLIFQEPCREGYVLMGAMAQFLPFVCAYAGRALNDGQREQAELFVKAMKFYARRDVDKAKAEDKHVFRVDDLMEWSTAAGMSLHFAPNTTFEHFAQPAASRPRPDRFRQFFHDYLRYCMNFDAGLLELFDEHMGPYCEWVDSLCDAGSPPYMHGVFLAKRA